MNVILAELVTLVEGELFATMGPLTPFEFHGWFESLSPEMQGCVRKELIPVEAVNISPYLDELWGGWIVTCYDANNDIVLRRRFNDKHVAEAHAASIQGA